MIGGLKPALQGSGAVNNYGYIAFSRSMELLYTNLHSTILWQGYRVVYIWYLR